MHQEEECGTCVKGKGKHFPPPLDTPLAEEDNSFFHGLLGAHPSRWLPKAADDVLSLPWAQGLTRGALSDSNIYGMSNGVNKR